MSDNSRRRFRFRDTVDALDGWAVHEVTAEAVTFTRGTLSAVWMRVPREVLVEVPAPMPTEPAEGVYTLNGVVVERRDVWDDRRPDPTYEREHWQVMETPGNWSWTALWGEFGGHDVTPIRLVAQRLVSLPSVTATANGSKIVTVTRVNSGDPTPARAIVRIQFAGTDGVLSLGGLFGPVAAEQVAHAILNAVHP